MSCHFAPDVACYVLGSLEPAERAKLETHLVECDFCRTELVDFAGLPGLLSRVTAQEARAGLPAARPQSLERLLVRAGEQRRTRRHRLIAAAAALILIAGGVVGGFTLTRPAETASTASAAAGLVQARVRVVGADAGSKITLSLTGVRSGVECRLVAIGKDGGSRDAGSWYASDGGYASVDETAAFKPAELAALRVETLAGQELVTIPLNG